MNLREAVEARGGVVVAILHCEWSGRGACWFDVLLPAMAEFARGQGAVLLAATTDRLLRSESFRAGHKRLRRAQACPSRKCHLGRDRRRLIGLSVGARSAPILRPSTQAVTSLPAENSSTSTAPPGGTRPGGSCFTHPPAAILIPRRLVQAIRNAGGRMRMALFRGVWCVLRLLLLPHSQLVLENLALRQQLAILRRSVRRPRLRPWDRLFWVWLSRCWAGWKDALAIVTPATVVGWHRQGFRLYWRWKSRGRPGPAAHRSRTPPAHPPPEPGESAVGRAADSGRAAAAGLRRGRVHRGQVQGAAHAAAVADLAFLPRQPRRLPGLGRFLRRAHGHVSAALWFPCAAPRTAPRRPLQRDSASDRGMGSPPDPRGLPL